MNIADLNLRHLRLLSTSVREGSLSGAAAKAGVTQSAVSQAIARLETLTGATLLERSKAGAKPTDAGILLAARAETAAAAMAKGYRAFRSGGNGGRPGAETDVTMAQLQAMAALDEHGSYVAAAAAMGIAEPTLHRAIGDLERQSGVALVERAGRGIAVTEAGRRTAAAFRVAAAELRAAIDELAVLGGKDQGFIRLAATPAALGSLVPRAVTRFLAEHPPVRFEISETSGDEAEPLLRDGRLDVALLPAKSGLREGLKQEPVIDDYLYIVGRDGHALSEGPTPGAMRLASFQWVMPPAGAPERHAFEKLFLDDGLFPPDVAITCTSLTARLAIVAEGEMLTLLSSHLMQRGLVSIGDPLARGASRLAIVTRIGWFPTPAQAAFLDELRGTRIEEEVLQF